jgi:hypothetical protein
MSFHSSNPPWLRTHPKLSLRHAFHCSFQRGFHQSGDIVFANKGFLSIVGTGKSDGEYYFDSTRGEFKQCLKVNWEGLTHSEANFTSTPEFLIKRIHFPRPLVKSLDKLGKFHGFPNIQQSQCKSIRARKIALSGRFDLNRRPTGPTPGGQRLRASL